MPRNTLIRFLTGDDLAREIADKEFQKSNLGLCQIAEYHDCTLSEEGAKNAYNEGQLKNTLNRENQYLISPLNDQPYYLGEIKVAERKNKLQGLSANPAVIEQLFLFLSTGTGGEITSLDQYIDQSNLNINNPFLVCSNSNFQNAQTIEQKEDGSIVVTKISSRNIVDGNDIEKPLLQNFYSTTVVVRISPKTVKTGQPPQATTTVEYIKEEVNLGVLEDKKNEYMQELGDQGYMRAINIKPQMGFKTKQVFDTEARDKAVYIYAYSILEKYTKENNFVKTEDDSLETENNSSETEDNSIDTENNSSEIESTGSTDSTESAEVTPETENNSSESISIEAENIPVEKEKILEDLKKSFNLIGKLDETKYKEPVFALESFDDEEISEVLKEFTTLQLTKIKIEILHHPNVEKAVRVIEQIDKLLNSPVTKKDVRSVNDYIIEMKSCLSCSYFFGANLSFFFSRNHELKEIISKFGEIFMTNVTSLDDPIIIRESKHYATIKKALICFFDNSYELCELYKKLTKLEMSLSTDQIKDAYLSDKIKVFKEIISYILKERNIKTSYYKPKVTEAASSKASTPSNSDVGSQVHFSS